MRATLTRSVRGGGYGSPTPHALRGALWSAVSLLPLSVSGMIADSVARYPKRRQADRTPKRCGAERLYERAPRTHSPLRAAIDLDALGFEAAVALPVAADGDAVAAAEIIDVEAA